MAAPLVMRGKVTNLDGRAPSVEVPDLGVGYSIGPVETTTVGPLAIGDRVLVVSVSGIPEDLVVIGVLGAGLDEDRVYTKAEADARFAAVGHDHAGVYAPAAHTHA